MEKRQGRQRDSPPRRRPTRRKSLRSRHRAGRGERGRAGAHVRFPRPPAEPRAGPATPHVGRHPQLAPGTESRPRTPPTPDRHSLPPAHGKFPARPPDAPAHPTEQTAATGAGPETDEESSTRDISGPSAGGSRAAGKSPVPPSCRAPTSPRRSSEARLGSSTPPVVVRSPHTRYVKPPSHTTDPGQAQPVAGTREISGPSAGGSRSRAAHANCPGRGAEAEKSRSAGGNPRSEWALQSPLSDSNRRPSLYKSGALTS